MADEIAKVNSLDRVFNSIPSGLYNATYYNELRAENAARIAGIGSKRVEVALLLAFFTGVVQLLIGLLRFGNVMNLMSRPVISGFQTAAAITIAMSQMKNLFGCALRRSLPTRWEWSAHLSSAAKRTGCAALRHFAALRATYHVPRYAYPPLTLPVRPTHLCPCVRFIRSVRADKNYTNSTHLNTTIAALIEYKDEARKSTPHCAAAEQSVAMHPTCSAALRPLSTTFS